MTTEIKPLKSALLMEASGYKTIAKRYDLYAFLSVINNTDNTIEVYEGQVIEGEEKNSVITIQPYTSLTVPIDNRQNFTFIWSDGGISGQKKADVIFSVENLGYNSSLGPTVSGTITISAEPATAADNATGLPTVLKVVAGYDGANVQAIHTDAQGDVQVDVLSLPPLAAGTNNIGDVDVLTLPAISLAASSNNIGDVDVLTLPNVTLNGFSFSNDALSHTVNALKGAAGVLHGVNVNTAGTTSTIVLYDSLTGAGTKIATIDTTVKGFHQFDAIFATGLSYITAGGAPADITLMYR